MRRAAHARAAAARRAVRVVMRRRTVACWPTVAAVAGWAAVPAPPPAIVGRRAAAVPHLGARSVRIVHARPSMVVGHRRPVRQGAGAGGHGIAWHRPLDLNLPSGKGRGWAVWRNGHVMGRAAWRHSSWGRGSGRTWHQAAMAPQSKPSSSAVQESACLVGAPRTCLSWMVWMVPRANTASTASSSAQ